MSGRLVPSGFRLREKLFLYHNTKDTGPVSAAGWTINRE